MRAIAFVVALGWSAAAVAEPTPPTPPTSDPAANATNAPSEAEALFDAGRALLAEHPAEACDRFVAALTVDPDAAGVMLNLGLCNRALDRFATALVWFRRAQTRGAETQLAEIEAAAREHAAELAGLVATASLTLVGATEAVGTTVIVLDGVRVSAVDIARVELDAGHHVIAVTDDVGTSRRELDIADGEAATLALVVPHRDVQVDAIDRGAIRRHRAKLLAFASGGVLGATLIAGVVAHRVASDPATGIETEARLQSAFAWGVTPVATVGIAAGALAAFWYATAPGVEHRRRIVPIVDAGRLGVAVTTRF
jgi:hypothetical protein